MNKYLKIFIFILLGLFQATIIPMLSVKGIYPNIIFITVMALMLLENDDDALLLAATGGITMDFFSQLPFGVYTILFIGLVFLVRLMSRKFIPSLNIILIFLVIFVTSLMFGSIVNILMNKYYITEILTESTYNALLGLAIYTILRFHHNQSQMLKIFEK